MLSKGMLHRPTNKRLFLLLSPNTRKECWDRSENTTNRKRMQFWVGIDVRKKFWVLLSSEVGRFEKRWCSKQETIGFSIVNLYWCPVEIYYRKPNGFLFWTPTFFKSTYLQAQEHSEKKSDIDSDSQLHALSIGGKISAIRALLRTVWDPWK